MMFVLEDSPDSMYSILNDIVGQLEAHRERLFKLVDGHPACCRSFITISSSGNIYVHSQVNCIALSLEEFHCKSMIHVKEFRQSAIVNRLLAIKLEKHYNELSRKIEAVK